MTARLIWVGLMLWTRSLAAAPAPDSVAAPPQPMHDHAAMGHDHAAMIQPSHTGHGMPALLERTANGREASGTAWQPDGTVHQGLHGSYGPWMLMAHGYFDLVGRSEGGPRGDDKGYGASMLMGTASRPLGIGRFGVRSMVSTDPFTIGKHGYPLLLQTGETADGEHPLIDRQHPHDLFMELATTYSIADATRSVFAYFGYPGEPALGPPVFMHRFSGLAFTEAPISHHWLDSTHISFGVATLGVISGEFKLEGSSFTGREPDEERYDFDRARFDSHSIRASWNPGRWAMQASLGHIESPEQLAPDEDVDRRTISIMRAGGTTDSPWQAMFAWGQNRVLPGPILDAYLLEAARESGPHTLFARGEIVEKNELFQEPDPHAGFVYMVGRVGAGYARELTRANGVSLSVGGEGAISFVPPGLEGTYDRHALSGALFVRARLR